MEKLDCSLVLESSSHGIIATDRAGYTIYANRRAKEILNTRRGKKMIGVSINTIMPKTAEMVFKCLETGQPQPGGQIFGCHVNLVVNISPIHDRRRLKGAVCYFLTMSEFETYARKLDAFDFLNRKFKTVFDSSSDGIWICDHEGRVIEINRASEQLGGLKSEDIKGKRVAEIVRNGLYSSYVTDEVIAGGKPVSQLQYIRNTHKTVLCTGIPVFNDRGQLTHVVINERDITQLEVLKLQLEETRQEREKYKDEIAELQMRSLKDQKIVAESDAMQAIIKTALKLARMEVNGVLILGESGTGKGLLAKFIHNSSRRRKKPFIQINCAALPESLLEAELFGYEKGAFSGAGSQGKPGLFELAHEGTLFLDEIGELPFALQAKLLKYLDDHEVMRLGGTRPRVIDCIILAATNQHLEAHVKARRFREDLFYRLNSITIKMPALKGRFEDIFALADYFLDHYNRKYNQNKRLTPLTLSLLQSYPFRGNVRELKNLIKKAVILSEQDDITKNLLGSVGREVLDEWSRIPQESAAVSSLDDVLAALEKEMLKSAKRRCRTTREMAAFLNISQSGVIRRLKKHHLSPNVIRNRLNS